MAVYVSVLYSRPNVDDSVKTSTRFTWSTWLETLDRVNGLAFGVILGLVIKLATTELFDKGNRKLSQSVPSLGQKLKQMLAK